MFLFKKTHVLCLRAAALLSAVAAFILTAIDPIKFRQAADVIHTLLWIYAFITVSVKLAARIAPPKSTGVKVARSSSGVIWLSILIWMVLLAAGYMVFMLLPFRSYSLLVAAVAFLGVLEVFFINAWCPFAKLITHARCCHSCRLKNWGEAMVLSPLLAMPSWWGMALLIPALALLVKFEIVYQQNPLLNPANKSCAGCAELCGLKNNKEPDAETIAP